MVANRAGCGEPPKIILRFPTSDSEVKKIKHPSLAVFCEHGGVHLYFAGLWATQLCNTVNATVGGWPSVGTVCFTPC